MNYLPSVKSVKAQRAKVRRISPDYTLKLKIGQSRGWLGRFDWFGLQV
jgi:hypothetical protein